MGNGPSMVVQGREGGDEHLDAARTGGRVGGRVEAATPPTPPSPPPAAPLLAPWQLGLRAAALLVGLWIGSALFGGGPSMTTYTFSSSYSETVVRADGGDGEPTLETRSQSSFSTNVPGLAERVAASQASRPRPFEPWFEP